MGKIQQLSAHEAQKIAAGEVIERPVNALKELIENSIDAGARTITIYLEQGGHGLIRVIDDGSGMDEADALLCFAHHATSKINRVEDVARLSTFGFRGEALTSIDAVSALTLITKTAAAPAAIQITRHAGTPVAQTTIAYQTGTDIAIKDLFFNVPARKKFLKTVDTEMRACVQLFHAFCYAYPAIHFTLYSNNKELYNCPATDTLLNRARQLDPEQDNGTLLAYTSQAKEITVHGLMSPPHMHKYDRSHFFFFVNTRWVRNPQLIKAVLKGYAGILPPERYPFGALHITIDASMVDINIHPRKQEVQFLHPRRIETFISATIKEQLENYTKQHVRNPMNTTAQSPALRAQTFSTFPAYQTAPLSFDRLPPSPGLWRAGMMSTGYSSNTVENPYDASGEALRDLSIEVLAKQGTSVRMSTENNLPEISYYSKGDIGARPEFIEGYERTQQQTVATRERETIIIGQLLTTYIMAQQDGCLVLVDQHAAHERILYEKIRAQFGAIASVPLLFAQQVRLEQQILDLFELYFELCASFGLVIERMSTDLIHICATPVHTQTINYGELVQDIAGFISTHQTLEPTILHKKIHEHTHAQMACKAAVKAGDVLSMTQMHQIMTDLFNTNNCSTCPHDRPTIWRISQYEIEKKFKRVM